MKKITTLIFILAFQYVGAQDYERLRDEYMQQFSPDQYSALKAGEAIINQSKSMVNSLYQNLQQTSQLVNTMDPAQLLRDFNSKMARIDQLEAQYGQQSFEMGLQVGEQLSNSIKSGDANSTIANFGGAINMLMDADEAEDRLKAQRAALQQQKRNQMNRIYQQAQEQNNAALAQYVKAAAFSESVVEERYYQGFVQNLINFSWSMHRNFSINNTNWLQNNGAFPEKNFDGIIENKFVTKDVQYKTIAQRKFDFYMERREIGNPSYAPYRESAISYIAAAIKTNPKAEYYTLMAKYNEGISTVLELTNYLAAEAYDSSVITNKMRTRINFLKGHVESEINRAISSNNINYLRSFLAFGLDKVIYINKKSILTHSIKLDKPDAMQTILNQYVTGKTQSQINAIVQKTIMIAAINNSTASLQRFANTGVSFNYSLKSQSPMSIAKKAKSYEAYLYIAQQVNDMNSVQDATNLINTNDIAAFKTAIAVNSVSGYENYLKAYPNGLSAKTAKIKINELKNNALKKREDALFAATKQNNTILTNLAYMREYKQGRYFRDVSRNLARLYFEEGQRLYRNGNYSQAKQSFENSKRYDVDNTYRSRSNSRINNLRLYTDYVSLNTFTIDHLGAIGYSMDDIDYSSLGMYIHIKMNPEIFTNDILGSTFEPGDNDVIVNKGELHDFKYTFSTSVGFNQHMIDRLFIYYGLGVGYYQDHQEVTLRDTQFATEYKAYKEGENFGWGVFPEFGAIYFLENGIGIKYGMAIGGGLTHQLGLSFTLF